MQTKFEQWELVEVSDDGVDWKEVTFNRLTGRITYPYYSMGWVCYAYCRKIKEKKEEEEKTSQYAVFVAGKQSPSKLNHTLESAIKESERLCSKENKKAYIVRLVWVQSPKVVSEFTSL